MARLINIDSSAVIEKKPNDVCHSLNHSSVLYLGNQPRRRYVPRGFENKWGRRNVLFYRLRKIAWAIAFYGT
jgi:hypothetical protein